MEVSNSTGRDSDYRVGATTGGTAIAALSPMTGCLQAGKHAHLNLEHGAAWTVEFLVDGSVVASGKVSKSSTRVRLLQGPGGYSVEVTPAL
jgi:hypothetical protein